MTKPPKEKLFENRNSHRNHILKSKIKLKQVSNHLINRTANMGETDQLNNTLDLTKLIDKQMEGQRRYNSVGRADDTRIEKPELVAPENTAHPQSINEMTVRTSAHKKKRNLYEEFN